LFTTFRFKYFHMKWPCLEEQTLTSRGI